MGMKVTVGVKWELERFKGLEGAVKGEMGTGGWWFWGLSGWPVPKTFFWNVSLSIQTYILPTVLLSFSLHLSSFRFFAGLFFVSLFRQTWYCEIMRYW